jgi:ribose 5-phosphate isomerase A
MSEDVDRLKLAAAESAAEQVRSGMIVGLGSGSTAALAVDAIGKRVARGLQISGIPTSETTARQARALGIALRSLDEISQVDMTIDGADEVEDKTLNLIKGHGGALLREKIVASASRQLVIVVDEDKLVERLGSHFAVPVEIVPFGWEAAARRLADLGGRPVLRRNSNGEPFRSDGGHYILDCEFGPIASPDSLARELDHVVGLVEHGLFIGMATEVRIASPAGVRVLTRPARHG